MDQTGGLVADKKTTAEAMQDVNEAFKNLIHAFAEVLYPVFDRILDWIYPPKGKNDR